MDTGHVSIPEIGWWVCQHHPEPKYFVIFRLLWSLNNTGQLDPQPWIALQIPPRSHDSCWYLGYPISMCSTMMHETRCWMIWYGCPCLRSPKCFNFSCLYATEVWIPAPNLAKKMVNLEKLTAEVPSRLEHSNHDVPQTLESSTVQYTLLKP